MKVIEGIQELGEKGHMVVTSGTFDGVHVGHRKILQRVNELARANNGKSVVITFWPHPRYILGNADTLKLLSSWEEKERLIRELKIDYLIRIPFTKEFSDLTGIEFIQKVLVDAIGTKKLVIGYDHRFGKNREGSFEYLKDNAPDFGFEVEEIPRQDIEHMAVSSTKIRTALVEGNVALANEFLGYNYSLEGIVVEGDRIGREMGFPTANIEVQNELKLIPADGIYAVHVDVGGKRYDGMLYIGSRPTLKGSPRKIEVNIFNFTASIYGENIRVSFVEQLRHDKRFETLDALRQQLFVDKEQALEVLKAFK
jgi:riboflavin kinase/FMN adenylyltransferase